MQIEFKSRGHVEFCFDFVQTFVNPFLRLNKSFVPEPVRRGSWRNKLYTIRTGHQRSKKHIRGTNLLPWIFLAILVMRFHDIWQMFFWWFSCCILEPQWSGILRSFPWMDERDGEVQCENGATRRAPENLIEFVSFMILIRERYFVLGDNLAP